MIRLIAIASIEGAETIEPGAEFQRERDDALRLVDLGAARILPAIDDEPELTLVPPAADEPKKRGRKPKVAEPTAPTDGETLPTEPTDGETLPVETDASADDLI